MGSSASSDKPKGERERQKNKFFEGKLKIQNEGDNNVNDKNADSTDDTTTVTQLESCSSAGPSINVCRNSKADNANTENHKTEAQSHRFKVQAQNQNDIYTKESTNLSDETTNEVQSESDIKRDTNSENIGELRDITKSETPQTETSGSLNNVHNGQKDTVDDQTTCGFDREDKCTESNKRNTLTPKQTSKAPNLTPTDSITIEDSKRNTLTPKQTGKAPNLTPPDSITIEGSGHEQQFETKTVERQERLLDMNKVKKRKDRGKRKANKDTTQQLETGQSTTKPDPPVHGEAQDQESNCLSGFGQNPKKVRAEEKSVNTEKVSMIDSKQLDDTLTDDVIASCSVEERASTVSKFEVSKGKSVNENTDVLTSWSPTTSENQSQVDDIRFGEAMKNRNSVADSKKTVNGNDNNPKPNILKQDYDSKLTVRNSNNDTRINEEVSARMLPSTKNSFDDSILDQKTTEKDSKFQSKDNTDESKLNEEEYPEKPKLTANKQLKDHPVTDRQELKSDKGEEDKLTANLEFYRNKIKSRPPPGHTIEQMLSWHGNFKELESNHRYIQWLFPMFENSGMNPGAQALQIHEAEAIKEDLDLQDRVLRAIKMMLHFYGMTMVSETDKPVKFSRAKKIWKERYEHLNRSTHNHLRITRILRSIGYLGYEHLQYPWFEFILQESYAKDTLLPRLQGDCVKYWLESFENQEDQLKAVELWTRLDSETKQPSRTDSDKKDTGTKCKRNTHNSHNSDVTDKPHVKD